MNCTICKIKVTQPLHGSFDPCSLRCGHIYHNRCVKTIDIVAGKRKCTACEHLFVDDDVVIMKCSSVHYEEDLGFLHAFYEDEKQMLQTNKNWAAKIEKLREDRYEKLEPMIVVEDATCFICETKSHVTSKCPRPAVIRSMCKTLRSNNQQVLHVLAKGSQTPGGPIIDRIQRLMFPEAAREMTRAEVYWTFSKWYFPDQMCTTCGLAFCLKTCDPSQVGGHVEFTRLWQMFVLPRMEHLKRYFRI